MNATALRAWSELQPRYLGAGWLATQDERKQLEASFHDSDRSGTTATVADGDGVANRRFYAAAAPVSDMLQSWIVSRSSGRVFLDYACGNGWQAIAAAKAGAELSVGIDISEISVRNAIGNAIAERVDNTTCFLQRDCEATGLPDASVDVCLCSGMLHHLDLDRAFPELHRLLAPGGEILCIEALRYNPVINLYRRLTPSLRTSWESEHILGLADLRLAGQWFDVVDVRYHLLASPLGAFLPSGRMRGAAIRLGWVLDSLLTRIPGVQLWSWMFSFKLVKRR